MPDVKTWDVIIIGGGIIGISLALALRKKGVTVLIVERGEPGREASSAAGGMLVDCPLETRPELQQLATASARMYPEFVHELKLESGIDPDLREFGTIVFPCQEHLDAHPDFNFTCLSTSELKILEPALADLNQPAFYRQERSVDPRALVHAAIEAAKCRGVDFSSGDAVCEALVSNGHISGVRTVKTTFSTAKVVNCAGAWAGKIPPHALPTRPMKGQMLCLVTHSHSRLKHVVRSPEVYLIPRSDGRILVGATVEDVGFDKRTDPETIRNFHRAAIALVPELRNARIHENWAGLRPGTPDGLPMLGATATPGYYVATGHFRDGILLAPITAQIMAEVIVGCDPGYDLKPFAAARFSSRL
ncbi:MAG TPA: glycine oxidase ThiO [Candidatus Sulfotelmatobacter sp.]|nr:glycine oxidase ThiO [Candidatus Sulfotelmatobacter sp.]